MNVVNVMARGTVLRRPVLPLRSAGFSLVEILLVILILLMLAGATVMYVLPQQEGAQRNTTRLKLESMVNSLNLYRMNVGRYPGEEEGGLQALIKKPQYENEQLAAKWQGPYLKPGATLLDAWDRPIRYELVDKSLAEDKSGADYLLYSVGADGLPDTDDDVRLVEASTEGGLDSGSTGTGGAASGLPIDVDVTPGS